MSKLIVAAVTLALATSSSRAEPGARHDELEQAIARHFHEDGTLKLDIRGIQTDVLFKPAPDPEVRVSAPPELDLPGAALAFDYRMDRVHNDVNPNALNAG